MGKTKHRHVAVLCFGDPAGIRTPDTLLKRQVLCRLSYWVKYIRKTKGDVYTSGRCTIRDDAWQGWLDSNQRVRESKSLALPLGYTPVSTGLISEGSEPMLRPFRPVFLMGWGKGLEPSTPGTTIRCSNQLSYTHHIR